MASLLEMIFGLDRSPSSDVNAPLGARVTAPPIAYRAGAGVRTGADVALKSVTGLNEIAAIPGRAAANVGGAAISAGGRAAGDFYRGMTGGPVVAPPPMAPMAPANTPVNGVPGTSPAVVAARADLATERGPGATPQYNLPVNQRATGSIDATSSTLNNTRISDAPAAPIAAPAPVTPAPQMVSASEYDRMRGGGVRRADFGLPDTTPIDSPIGRTWAGNAVGAMLNIGERRNEARRQFAADRLGADIALRQDATAATREGHRLSYGAATYGHDISAANNAAKLANDRLLKGPGAMADAAKAGIDQATLAMAKAARARGASEQEVAAILGRRAAPEPTYTVPMTSMPDKTGAIDVLQSRGPGAGNITKVTPVTRATEQTIKDTLATNPALKGSRAKAIEALKNTGRYDTAGLR